MRYVVNQTLAEAISVVLQDKPKPPMKCVPIGKQFEPDPGEDKWVLKKDHTVQVLYKEFEDVAAGGWRNKVLPPALHHPLWKCQKCRECVWRT